MIDKFKDTFKEEAYELLNKLEDCLLVVEENPDNRDEVSALFRTMHTIKGSAAMFGFQHISDFTHEVESILELVREGKIKIGPELIDLTLKARDHIRNMLDQEDPPPKQYIQISESLENQFRALVESRTKPAQKRGITVPPEAGIITDEESAGKQVKDEKPVREDTLQDPVTYRIRFKPGPDLFQNGTNPLMLLDELRDLGEFTCVSYTDSIPALNGFDPEVCSVYWDIILTTNKNKNRIRDVFVFVEDSAHIDIDCIDNLTTLDDGRYKRLGDILEERGVIDNVTIEHAAARQKRLGEMLVEEGVNPTEIESALEEQRHVERVRQRAQNELASSSIRVSSEKLDELVDLVGELVTLQARFSQTSNQLGNGEITSLTENLERLTSELRDGTMTLRMLPIGTTFSKFRRLVRDLSQELGKEVDIATFGGETELDKTVIEKLNDPLIHIIRNCIDHGIEDPENRKNTGKKTAGTIKLSAEHSGASVLISIEDDGKGLDKQKIFQKALDREIVSEGTQLTDEEIYELIFAPGFSTAAQVTNVSGRGVGMDVVKRAIEGLGGSVSVESETGKFTRITLKIPLTLAIIEGLLVEVCGEHYVFPLAAVEECIEHQGRDKRRDDKNILSNRGEVLPYIRLSDLFNIEKRSQEIEQIVVVNSNGSRIGFVVDNVIGDYQTVIKNLGKMYKNISGISGATILGDGSVALILDVNKLVTICNRSGEEVLQG
ncbi:MAG: chemotaxis protein CheA [Spirochaetia bacterium]